MTLSDPAYMDEHLDRMRERNQTRAQAAAMRDLASRQRALADAAPRTADDVLAAITHEAERLESHAARVDKAIRGTR